VCNLDQNSIRCGIHISNSGLLIRGDADKTYHTNTQFRSIPVYLLFCMGVKHGFSHKGMNIYCGCLRRGCWGEYLDLRARKWREAREDYIMWSSITYTLHQILLGWSNQEWDGQDMWHAWDIKMHNKFWSENLKRRDHSEDLGVDGKIILQRVLRK
jgi:hypothetical protein